VNRTEKVETRDRLAEIFRTPHLFLADYRGLSGNQSAELRRKVRAVGGSFRVIKNRIAKRAAEGTAVEQLVDHFVGPRAVAYHDSDPVALAKALTDFAKDNPQLEILAGAVDAERVLDAPRIKELASLPGLPELRAQLLAMIQTPATTLVRLLGTPGTQIARVIDAHRESAAGGAGQDS